MNLEVRTLVLIPPVSGYCYLFTLQSHEEGVLAWISGSETSLLNLNFVKCLIFVTNYSSFRILEISRDI